jgi:threonine/homoserine/homoserine lactone efflux protein
MIRRHNIATIYAFGERECSELERFCGANRKIANPKQQSLTQLMAGELVNVNPQALNSTIEFLTAMVTPTLLISATGSLVLSTSTRLGRVVDRARDLEKRLGEMIYVEDKSEVPLYDIRLEVIMDLLDKVTSRSRLLQRAMGAFYYGLCIFVLTSVTIAVAGLFNIYRWLPIPVGVIGIMFVLYGSLLMVKETRMATATVNAEMDFTWKLAREVAPEKIASKYSKKGLIKGKNGPKVSRTLGGE